MNLHCHVGPCRNYLPFRAVCTLQSHCRPAPRPEPLGHQANYLIGYRQLDRTELTRVLSRARACCPHRHEASMEPCSSTIAARWGLKLCCCFRCRVLKVFGAWMLGVVLVCVLRSQAVQKNWPHFPRSSTQAGTSSLARCAEDPALQIIDLIAITDYDTTIGIAWGSSAPRVSKGPRALSTRRTSAWANNDENVPINTADYKFESPPVECSKMVLCRLRAHSRHLRPSFCRRDYRLAAGLPTRGLASADALGHELFQTFEIRAVFLFGVQHCRSKNHACIIHRRFGAERQALHVKLRPSWGEWASYSRKKRAGGKQILKQDPLLAEGTS